MYVGRKIDQLQNVSYDKWSLEELAYHRDTMQNLSAYLTPIGQRILDEVSSEIYNRGGLPDYEGGDYERPASFHYD